MAANKSMQSRAVKQNEVVTAYMQSMSSVSSTELTPFLEALEHKSASRARVQRSVILAGHTVDEASAALDTAAQSAVRYAQYVVALMPASGPQPQEKARARMPRALAYLTEVFDLYSRTRGASETTLHELEHLMKHAATAQRALVTAKTELAALEKRFDFELKTELGAIVMAKAALQNADALPRGRKRKARVTPAAPESVTPAKPADPPALAPVANDAPDKEARPA